MRKGQAIRRDESDANATAIANRTASQGTGAFANGATGDSSLWYKIAELNGLTADSALIEGTPLLIPVGVERSTNNAATFKPYDPAEIVGNTMPTAVKPPKSKHNCGVMGQILMVVIAVVVTIYTAGAASGAFAAMEGSVAGGISAGAAAGVAALGTASGLAGMAGMTAEALVVGGAVGGAVGSIVSQAVGVAAGIQDKFSWNAVALAAIGGGVGAGLGAAGVGGSGWQGAAIRGAVGNAITQGVGVATGLQSKFSWAGVAAAGVGGAVNLHYQGSGPFTQIAASAIADAATHSLLDGTDFGDNVLAALPNVVGETIGNSIAGALSGNGGTTGDGKSYDGAKFGQGVSKQLASYAAVCGADVQHHWYDGLVSSFQGAMNWLGDLTGISDGHIGLNAANSAATSDAVEQIVVTAQGIIRDGPRAIARGVTDTVHNVITKPIEDATHFVMAAIHHPEAADGMMQREWDRTNANLNRLARVDPFDAAQHLAAERYAHYQAEARRGGPAAGINAGLEDFGSASVFFAVGAYSGGEGLLMTAGVTAEDALLMSLRTRPANLNLNPEALQLALQGKTDLAMAELGANPALARGVLEPDQYLSLVNGGRMARANYGIAVERITADLVQDDPQLAEVFTHLDGPLQTSNGRFFAHPDFLAHDETSVYYFEMTTSSPREIARHSTRWYAPYTRTVTYPGLPPDLVFPK